MGRMWGKGKNHWLRIETNEKKKKAGTKVKETLPQTPENGVKKQNCGKREIWEAISGGGG